jgi:hypothetical protein
MEWRQTGPRPGRGGPAAHIDIETDRERPAESGDAEQHREGPGPRGTGRPPARHAQSRVQLALAPRPPRLGELDGILRDNVQRREPFRSQHRPQPPLRHVPPGHHGAHEQHSDHGD